MKSEANEESARVKLQHILAEQREREDKQIDQWTERIALDLVGQFGIQNYNQSRLIVLNVLDYFFSLLDEQQLELSRLRERIGRDRYLTTEVVNRIADSLVNYLQKE